MKTLRHAFLFLSLLVILGCQGEDTSEYYGNLLTSPSGLVITQEEHSLAWGRSDCFSCHVSENYHQDRDDRENFFDMSQIRDLLMNASETDCVQCHGRNGVSP